jgi:hypothetical protein
MEWRRRKESGEPGSKTVRVRLDPKGRWVARREPALFRFESARLAAKILERVHEPNGSIQTSLSTTISQN